MLSFEEYLVQKKIDSAAFRQGSPAQWQEFAYLFEQLHPNSFTAQKLFLMNAIRRKYPLQEDVPDEKAVKTVQPKVKIPTKKRDNS